MTNEEIDRLSQSIGIVGALISFGIPILLWRLCIRPWKATSAIKWGLKGALWPPVIFAWALGKPITFALFGIGSFDAFVETLIGVLGSFILFSPIGFVVGLVAFAARSRPPAEQPAPPQDG